MKNSILKTYVIRSVSCLGLSIAFAAGAQNTAASSRVINVRTVHQLYSAVNNPANRGATVRLAPGTYVLSSLYPGGASRPNQGALRMPPGMSLVGSEKRVDTNGDGVPDPVSDDAPDDFTVAGTETIIDGSALDLPPGVRTDCSGDTFSAPDPVIHVGVANTISHLTVVAGNNLAISEPTNNPVDPSGNLSMTVEYTILESSKIAMGFSNSECAARKARSTLSFSHNVVRGVGFIGVLIQNFLTGDASNHHSDGPAIWALLTSNLFYNNNKALQATGGEQGTDGGSVSLYMNGNVFRNNAANFQGQAGVAAVEIGNRLTLRSEFDSFGEAFSNISLLAGRGDTADDPQGGELEAEFLHSHFTRDSADTPAEISIIGGGGRHNRAEVLIRNSSVTTSAGILTSGGILIQNQSTPGIGTSKAKLEGSRSEFLHSNQGLPAPPARFFLE
jgi:hypothetical protein